MQTEKGVDQDIITSVHGDRAEGRIAMAEKAPRAEPISHAVTCNAIGIESEGEGSMFLLGNSAKGKADPGVVSEKIEKRDQKNSKTG